MARGQGQGIALTLWMAHFVFPCNDEALEMQKDDIQWRDKALGSGFQPELGEKRPLLLLEGVTWLGPRSSGPKTPHFLSSNVLVTGVS